MAYVTYPQFQRQRFRGTHFPVQRTTSQLTIPERPLRKPPSYRQTPPAPKVQQQKQQQPQQVISQAQPIYTYYPQNVASQQTLYSQHAQSLYSAQQSLYPIATIPTQQPQSYDYQYYPQTVTPIQRKPVKASSKESGPGWSLCWTFVKEGWCPYNPCHWSHGEGDYKRAAAARPARPPPSRALPIKRKVPFYGGGPQRRPRRVPPKNSNSDFDVCWEHNTAKGCSRGAKCWWKHSQLREMMVHPYTGEKLSGPRAVTVVVPKVYAAQGDRAPTEKVKPAVPVKTSEVATNTDPADWPAIAIARKAAVVGKDKAESDSDVKEYEAAADSNLDQATEATEAEEAAEIEDNSVSKSIAIQVTVLDDDQDAVSEETKSTEAAKHVEVNVETDAKTEAEAVTAGKSVSEVVDAEVSDDDEKKPEPEAQAEAQADSKKTNEKCDDDELMADNQAAVSVAADKEIENIDTTTTDRQDTQASKDAQKTTVLGGAKLMNGKCGQSADDKHGGLVTLDIEASKAIENAEDTNLVVDPDQSKKPNLVLLEPENDDKKESSENLDLCYDTASDDERYTEVVDID